jgi:hypothetical protein
MHRKISTNWLYLFLGLVFAAIGISNLIKANNLFQYPGKHIFSFIPWLFTLFGILQIINSLRQIHRERKGKDKKIDILNTATEASGVLVIVGILLCIMVLLGIAFYFLIAFR